MPRARALAAPSQAGALPALVGIVSAPTGAKSKADAATVGNASLCIAECAKEKRCLAVLAAHQFLVPALLAVAHEGKGQAQRNAAIALGRLAKNPHCLQSLRDNHGIEILARHMAPSQ